MSLLIHVFRARLLTSGGILSSNTSFCCSIYKRKLPPAVKLPRLPSISCPVKRQRFPSSYELRCRVFAREEAKLHLLAANFISTEVRGSRDFFVFFDASVHYNPFLPTVHAKDLNRRQTPRFTTCAQEDHSTLTSCNSYFSKKTVIFSSTSSQVMINEYLIFYLNATFAVL